MHRTLAAGQLLWLWVFLVQAAESRPVPAAAPPPPPPKVVFLGDSLTAGLGVDQDQAFPALLEAKFKEAGLPVQIVNAGISGDTTAGGLRRLDWLLGQEPDILVVGLGANDGLRGLPVAKLEENLREIIRRAQGAGARVLLLGMRMPPSHGPEYAAPFAAVYPRLAKELGVPLVPFLLEGVAGRADLNLADGIHPNPQGHKQLAETVFPLLREMRGSLQLK